MVKVKICIDENMIVKNVCYKIEYSMKDYSIAICLNKHTV